MNSKTTNEQRVLALARDRGIIRIQDLEEKGLHPEHLRRLVKQGQLIRAGRGMYMTPSAELSPAHTLALAAKWVPHGVVCLLSALSFHHIGTQVPSEVWIALERKKAKPRIDYPPLRIMRFSGRPLTEGIEEHRIEGVTVKIYVPPKTVADCFKYRNKIGLDVAIEALRECLRQRKCSNDDLWHYGRVCRIWNVMRPYMEVMS